MILIKDGRLIDPKTNLDEIRDVVIDGGIIKNIGKFHVDDSYEKVINAKGKIVAPGLIDTHVHFRDPGATYKEDMESGEQAAIHGGFTTVICRANTNPIVDNPETLKYVLDKASHGKIHIYTTAAITKGLGNEELTNMEELIHLGAIGFSNDAAAIMNEQLMIDAMKEADRLNVPITVHEKNPHFVYNAGINEGAISKQLNLKGSPNVAEDILVARDCMLALYTGATVTIQHISSGNSVRIIRMAKDMGAHVLAEVTPHHFSLTEDAVLTCGTMAKMDPPLRTKKDRFEIIEGLKDGTIEIIASDHAPHTDEEKNTTFDKAPLGVIGLETSLALGVTNLVRRGHLSMLGLLEKMTVNPAKLYHLDAGYICEGGRADLVIFDESECFTVEKEKFASKSSNSPFIGQKLYGKIKYTICNGEILYSDSDGQNPA